MSPASKTRSVMFVLVALVVQACGDDGGDEDAFPASAAYAARCATPRSGIDPGTGSPYPDRTGTLADEKLWLRSWTHELYLWYREVPDLSPGSYATAIAYFNALKTHAVTSSGKPKDQFHFTYETTAWEALSQSGVEAGYGVQLAIISGTPPRQIVAAYNQPGSPAATAGIARGAKVVTVDGVDVASGTDVNALNAGLFPAHAGEVHTFSILDLGATTPRTVTLTSADVEGQPVQNVKTISTPSGPVGYMLFNDHIGTAEDALRTAIGQLEEAGVTDLVLDIRYNGGGYLFIASQLAYMIAGPAATDGKTFDRIAFNDQHPTNDPVTGERLTPTPFIDTTVGASPRALPSLGLARVFVLTSGATCSASEAIINGLRGVDVNVIQIGKTTCGKPYGFYPQDNCGTTYFTIEFQGVNQKGFGDFADGFMPGGSGAAGLPGCDVADDFTHALGDPGEARLAAALAYRDTPSCPAAVALRKTGASSLAAVDGTIVKSPWLQNRQTRIDRR